MSYLLLAQVASSGNFQWLERLSWAANVVLALTAIVAIRQVFAAVKQAQSVLIQNKLTLDQIELSRKDIILRSRREATGLAIEQCRRFAESIIPGANAVYSELRKHNYQPPQKIDVSFPFVPQQPGGPAAMIWNDPKLRDQIVNSLNAMESFAQYFVSDEPGEALADETVAFTPTGLGFCTQAEVFAPFIGVFRQEDKFKLYQNLTRLYSVWKPRVDLTVLEEQGKKIETLKSKLPPNKPQGALGTKF